MIKQSFTAGFKGIRRRPGLVVLIYAMNLMMALILSIPVYIALSSTVGGTGFDADLAGGFDFVLWADIIEEASEALGALQFQLLWMIPLYLIWKAAASVGLIHALRGGDVRSFWQGVGRYTGKAVLLGLPFLVLAVIGFVGLLVVAGVLSAFWPGEVGAFWINLVTLPTLAISGLAVLDLMHDYGRMALVVSDQKVLRATGIGIAWPFKHGKASGLYVVWFVPAALLLLLPTVLGMTVAAATGGAIWGRFLMQQILLLLRAAVTVGWFGSETALYETIKFQEMPLIASEEKEASEVVKVSVSTDGLPGLEQDGF